MAAANMAAAGGSTMAVEHTAEPAAVHAAESALQSAAVPVPAAVHAPEPAPSHVNVPGALRFDVAIQDLNGEPYSLLNRLRLGQYADAMVRMGYDDVEDLLRMSSQELDNLTGACDMPQGHK
jgi:hypothetical protein